MHKLAVYSMRRSNSPKSQKDLFQAVGLLALGAAQGLAEDELYREALAFNAFWFPDTYIQTALYFKAVKKTENRT